MQAIILAAGMGKRLKALTADNTKCMVKLNGVTLIERMLSQLDSLGLSKIVIVCGYKGKKLIEFISSLNVKTPLKYVNNPVYYKTNNIYSLALAKDYLLHEDTLLLESDLVFEDSVLRSLVEDSRDTLALVDKYESWMDGTVIKIGHDDTIDAFVPGKSFVFSDIPYYYKTVNIYKFSRDFSEKYYVPFLNAYSSALGNNEYYEQVLRVITLLDEPVIKAKRLEGQLWYEIDDIQDLDIASSMFTVSDDDKKARLEERYGGYWRYPKLVDFCYLVNPYYPADKLKNEMKANFDMLLTQYPSGMKINSLLAAKYYGVQTEHIVIGNGAAELIKAVMEDTAGKVGFIRPTFEEYPNRCRADSVVFVPDNADFSYTADDVIGYFDDKDIVSLVVINPDNPTGNYIDRDGLLRLAAWAKNKKIRLIVDESFSDFASEGDNSLIDEKTLKAYPRMLVVKSISKSHGVPGVRLGVLASHDSDYIAALKRRVAIWNINSFGEFYMQIAEKYKKDYAASLEKLRASRERFSALLSEIRGVRVIPSEANYLMLELLPESGITSYELTKQLVADFGLFIKDLSKKVANSRQYIRVAVRTDEENALLARSITQILRRARRAAGGVTRILFS